MEIITITRDRLKELLVAEAKLQMLTEFGVDNWQGYDEAMYGDEEINDDSNFGLTESDVDAESVDLLNGSTRLV